MTFDEFRSLIEKSQPTDWRVIPGDGPTYQVRYGAITTPETGPRVDINEHHTLSVYTPDIDITLAFGMNMDFEYVDDRAPVRRTFDWSSHFPDEETTVCIADLFYRGSLVDRVNYVLVDGARACLPWAKEYDGLKTSRYEYSVARLLNYLPGPSQFDDYFTRAGFVVED